jgi:hypothetical protein
MPQPIAHEGNVPAHPAPQLDEMLWRMHLRNLSGTGSEFKCGAFFAPP